MGGAHAPVSPTSCHPPLISAIPHYAVYTHPRRGCPIGNASAHSSTGASWPRSRLATRQMLNPWTQGHLDPLDVICIDFDSIPGNFEKSCFCDFRSLDIRSWVMEYIFIDFRFLLIFFYFMFRVIYLYYMIFYEMEFMMQNI